MYFLSTVTPLVVALAGISAIHGLVLSNASTAVYTLQNAPGSANIVSLAVAPNGSLANPVLTPTGGRALSGAQGPGQPNVGGLFGSDAIVVSGNFLFSVNSGSNTVSMFSINPSDPQNLTLIGRPANSTGTFPMSLSYSPFLNQLCVLNGGSIAGVACYSVNPLTGLSLLDAAPRPLAGYNQTDPPLGPFNTTSDIKFNPSGTALFASVKGVPPPKNQTTPPTPPVLGTLYSWPVISGRVSNTPTILRSTSLILDFSLTFLGNDFNLLLTEPSIGADILGISTNLSVNIAAPINIQGEQAACWSVYYPPAQAAFIADAAQANITVIDTISGSVVEQINFNPAAKGSLDMAILGTNLYYLTAVGTMATIDISGIGNGNTPRVTGNFPLPGGNGSAETYSGAATYPALLSY